MKKSTEAPCLSDFRPLRVSHHAAVHRPLNAIQQPLILYHKVICITLLLICVIQRPFHYLINNAMLLQRKEYRPISGAVVLLAGVRLPTEPADSHPRLLYHKGKLQILSIILSPQFRMRRPQLYQRVIRHVHYPAASQPKPPPQLRLAAVEYVQVNPIRRTSQPSPVAVLPE